MGDTLENSLENIDGKSVLKDIKMFTNNIEENLNIKSSTNTLIGITLHIGCMLDRLVGNGTIEEFEGKISMYHKIRNFTSISAGNVKF
jgi:transcriptional regulatory protein LevR